ncbi:MAG: tRNA (cytidine(34)-2'-O)-methyltransferase [Candidatus Melainabacteria bacterium]
MSPVTQSSPSATAAPLLQQVAVVLVEPRIPQNTGNIARLCACTGASLMLVGSLGFRLHDRYLKRAGMDYLAHVAIEQFADWPDLMAAYPDWTPWFFSSKAARPYTRVGYPPRTLLVFGSETQGLPEALLDTHADRCVTLPMQPHPDVRSLNLSNTVAVAVYEAIRQQQGDQC